MSIGFAFEIGSYSASAAVAANVVVVRDVRQVEVAQQISLASTYDCEGVVA